jgi:adenylate cyclase
MKVNSIQFKIALLIFITLIGTLVVVLFFTINKHQNDLIDTNNTTLSTTTEQLNITIRNIMLDGEAPLAVNTLRDMNEITTLNEIDIYRKSGVRAFSDYSTLQNVNNIIEQKGYESFPQTERLEPKTLDNQYFRRILESPTPIPVDSLEKGMIEYYFPILNYKPMGCTDCHGEDHYIRGIAYINISTDVYKRINNSSTFLTIIFAGTAIVLIIILIYFLRRLIVNPLLDIGKTVNRVGDGDFSARVNINKKDELGLLASKINNMITNVEERFRLSKYVSKTTDKYIKQHKEIEEGEKKILTLLFSDIRGFTSYSETNEPQVVVKNLNLILQTQASIVESYGGDIDKFIGDELMAVFQDEHTAILSAIDMIKAVLDTNKEHSIDLHVGIGINSGEVISGNIGSKNRLEYAIIGDTINLASRLCDIAKPDKILISEDIYRNLKDKIKSTKLPNQKIKGKKKKIDIYVLNSYKDPKTDKWIILEKEENILKEYLTFPFKDMNKKDNPDHH